MALKVNSNGKLCCPPCLCPPGDVCYCIFQPQLTFRIDWQSDGVFDLVHSFSPTIPVFACANSHLFPPSPGVAIRVKWRITALTSISLDTGTFPQTDPLIMPEGLKIVGSYTYSSVSGFINTVTIYWYAILLPEVPEDTIDCDDPLLWHKSLQFLGRILFSNAPPPLNFDPLPGFGPGSVAEMDIQP